MGYVSIYELHLDIFCIMPRRDHAVQKSRVNLRILYLVGALSGFGLLMVYSASAVLAFYEGQSPFHYFLLQSLWVLLGGIAAFLVYKVPLKLVSRASVLGMVVTITLLVLVLIIGKDLNGARRWIDLGPFDLQPSEIAKLGFIIYLSAWLARARPAIKSTELLIKRYFKYELVPFVLLLGIVGVLIVLQPDLDTAVIIVLTSLAIYFVSGRDFLHNLGVVLIVITAMAVGVFAAVAAEYRVERVKTYVDFLVTGDVQDKRDSGFQVWNGLVAIGSGGVLGLGYTQSRQKFYYLQNAAFTDSIFSIVAEEFGLVGSVILIVVFLYFMSLGINVAQNAPDRFTMLLALGITTWITLQAFLNIGANLALIPFGGIPLPFVSYGGSNTVVTLVGVGLLLNVSRHARS